MFLAAKLPPQGHLASLGRSNDAESMPSDFRTLETIGKTARAKFKDRLVAENPNGRNTENWFPVEQAGHNPASPDYSSSHAYARSRARRVTCRFMLLSV